MSLARWLAALMSPALLAACLTAQAAGTAAGTNIQNAAQVSYTVGSSSVTASSNVVSVRVAEILDVVVTLASPTVSVVPGATQQVLRFTVTNTGNGSETFNLAALSAGVPGDDFDPTLEASAIYLDSDNNGAFAGSDALYAPGTNDPALPADASIGVFVLNSIPSTAGDGNRGRSELTARAATGTGAPGDAFTGGDGGVEAVAGTTGGDATLFGEYLVTGLQLSAVKSQSVADPFNGERPLPGARITYQVVVTALGAGTATAAAFADLIPTNTTYVAGSLLLNGAALTDAADADAGQLVSTPAPQVRVTLGDLTAASGPQTIEFAVTIN